MSSSKVRDQKVNTLSIALDAHINEPLDGNKLLSVMLLARSTDLSSYDLADIVTKALGVKVSVTDAYLAIESNIGSIK